MGGRVGEEEGMGGKKDPDLERGTDTRREESPEASSHCFYWARRASGGTGLRAAALLSTDVGSASWPSLPRTILGACPCLSGMSL